MTNRKYFGTDGVRGKVGQAPITPDLVMHLGYAAGEVLAKTNRPGVDHPTVLIGKDTRISGYLLESALQAGLSAAGVDTLFSGPLPTPAIAYLTRTLRLSAGIVISASHNPYDDNGIKFFGADGQKLPDEVESAIEARMQDPVVCMPSAKLGKARRMSDAPGRYIEFCKSTFPTELDLRGLKIVVDCANGAAYNVAGPVLHELGADVVVVANQPDGLNINAGVGATKPKYLAEQVIAHKADVGIALDGDADRLIMTDSAGRVYDGDELLYVIAANRKQTGSLTGGVVGTLMTNFALEQLFNSMGVPFARAAVGDRYVLELLLQKGWSLGGENSGHIVCLDKHTTGDGLISSLQVLTALRTQDTSLSKACAALKLMPQILINVPIQKGFDFRKSTAATSAIGAAETELAGRGRILLRPSGTEPVLRVMVEGENEAEVRQIASGLADVIKIAAAA